MGKIENAHRVKFFILHAHYHKSLILHAHYHKSLIFLSHRPINNIKYIFKIYCTSTIKVNLQELDSDFSEKLENMNIKLTLHKTY